MTAGGRRPNAIADYALIGDCHTSALVGRNGSIDWLCFPRPDSPAVFCHLLDDQHGGNFAVRMAGGEPERHYLPGTNVLVTTWHGPDGVLEVIDCMPVAPFDPTRPARVETRRSVLRRIACLAGTATAEIRVTPRFEYGLVVPRLRTPSAYVADFVGGGSSLRVRTTHPLERRDAHTLRRGDVLAADWSLTAGEVAWIEAAWAPAHDTRSDVPDPDPRGCERLLEETKGFWRAWLAGCLYQGEHVEQVQRSALVLKALTYAPTGAVLAAATTSLPEVLGGSRNWDYRYTWIRDATLTLASLFILGLSGEAAAFKTWVERGGAGRPQDLQIMYGVEGERLLPEVELDHLAGHRGSRPVRIGNGAVKQLQLDTFGQLLEAGYLFAKAGQEITGENWRFLSGLADICCEHWSLPDQGIWEVRDEPRHFLHSKASCWLALHRAVQLAMLLGHEPSARWAAERDRIRDFVVEAAAAPGYLPQAAGLPDVDAATLLVPAYGMLAADDPVVLATVDAVCHELSGAGGLLHRYRTDRGAGDGIAEGEGAFLLCSFWLVDLLLHAGKVTEAEARLDRLLALANDVGLYAEEIDPLTGEHLGNTPQAFTHMALVMSCAHLSAAKAGLLPLDGLPHDFTELAVERMLRGN